MNTPRRPAAVALSLALLAVLAAVLLVRLPAPDALGQPVGLRIAQAQVLEAGSHYPAAPPADDAGQTIDLPDNWDSRRPDYSGYVWYRIVLPKPLSNWQRPVLYLPAAAMNAEVWVDGRRAGGAGRMQVPLSRHFYTPQLVDLPAALQRRDGQAESLWVLVAGHPGYRCGLAPVWLGEHDQLYDAWRWRRAWQGEGTAVTVVVNLVIAAFMFALAWRDRSHLAHAWFGAAAAVWGLRNLNYVVVDPALPDLLFAELCVSGAAWFTALFTVFALRFSQAEQPAWKAPRSLPWLALLYAAVATLYFLSADSYRNANAGFAALAAVGVSFTLWSMVRLVRLALAVPRLDLIAVAAGAVVYLVLLLNDYAIGVDHQSLGEIFIRQYAALPLFLAITGTLSRRYLQALRQARQLAQSLQQQVQAQRAELELSFARLRDAERDQALAQERARLLGDLHDGLGLHLNTALRQARQPGVQPAALVDTLQDCLDDLRLAIDSLDEQERDPLSLLGSLRYRMVPRFAALGLQLAWQVDPDVEQGPPLEAGAALHLLRVVQEALANALKHSAARVVTLALGREQGRTVVTVSDDGHGFDMDRAASGRGLGHMRARAQRLRADLQWTSSAHGTTVRLLLPPAAAANLSCSP